MIGRRERKLLALNVMLVPLATFGGWGNQAYQYLTASRMGET